MERPPDPSSTVAPPSFAGGVLHEALDRSAHAAARGDAAPLRTVRGTPDEVWRAVSALIAGRARHEYLGFDDPTLIDRAGLPEHIRAHSHRTMRTALDRGVAVRQVTTASGLRHNPDDHPCLMWRSGGRVRTVEQLPYKACVIDRSFALVACDFAVFAEGVLVLRDPTLVGLLVRTYAELWRAGDEPVAAPGTAVADLPPARLLPVLEAMTSGLPDDRAAVRVGATPRTYSRRVAELMVLLGARSRFEAGLLAARRGWI